MRQSQSSSDKSGTHSLKTSKKPNNEKQLVAFRDNRDSSTTNIQKMANDSIQMKPNNTGLPNQLKSGIESLSGYSMDDIKVHYNSSKPAQLNAHAYAQGTDIHVASGQEKHLPHEAWHVVQQKQGRVQSTRQLKDKVNINDDAGLEREADVMGAKALQMKANQNTSLDTKVNGSKLIQRRVASPVGLEGASAAVKSGARTALIETLLDICAQGVTGITYVMLTLNMADSTRKEITKGVDTLNMTDLKAMITKVRTDYPNQVFDSSSFDVKPTTGSQGEAYVTALVNATRAKMLIAANNENLLRDVFGDGTRASIASGTAAAKAKSKILDARTKLDGFLNIFIDNSGIAGRVGIGGYAGFNRKIFLLVQDVTEIPPSNNAISTLFHESMHLTHAEILDDGGYSSTGTRFSGAQINAKLTNADHYAEVARIMDGSTTHALPFTPNDPTAVVPAVLTNPNDTANTMGVRNNVMHRDRQLWSGAADLFMGAVRDKRLNNDWWNRKSRSKKLNMTYHNTGKFSTPELNETDLSLAEGSVNRIHRFTKFVTNKMKSASQSVFNMINTKYTGASGTGQTKIKNAGMDVLVSEGEVSNILAPQDKTPSVRERFTEMSR